MKRRHVLGVLAALPLARRLAFADATIGQAVKRGGLAKPAPGQPPLVVLVIPEGDEAKYRRGRALGEWIEEGKPAELAPLAVANLCCAEMSEVKRVANVSGEPWMVVLDDAGRAEALAGASPGKMLWSSKVLTARLAAQTISVSLAGEQVKQRLAKDPPPGSHWARDSFCGFETVEKMPAAPGDEKIAMDCGMGHVDGKSARFLYFWTKTPETRWRERYEKRSG